MPRTITYAALSALLFAGAAVSAEVIDVTVQIENLSPADGTWLTPVWVGFHDGSFDTASIGDPAGADLERLAEDGNTGPLMDAFTLSGLGTQQGTIVADTGIPPLAPGETATMTFMIDTDVDGSYFSFASMVIPSNDAFITNLDPMAYQLWDGGGNFIGADIMVWGSDVLDAGTEVNDEIPANTAFFGQMDPDTGVDENGVVHAHPGYLPLGSGGILDDPMFAGADFTQPGYQLARITVVPQPGALAMLGLGGLVTLRRRRG